MGEVLLLKAASLLQRVQNRFEEFDQAMNDFCDALEGVDTETEQKFSHQQEIFTVYVKKSLERTSDFFGNNKKRLSAEEGRVSFITREAKNHVSKSQKYSKSSNKKLVVVYRTYHKSLQRFLMETIIDNPRPKSVHLNIPSVFQFHDQIPSPIFSTFGLFLIPKIPFSERPTLRNIYPSVPFWNSVTSGACAIHPNHNTIYVSDTRHCHIQVISLDKMQFKHTFGKYGDNRNRRLAIKSMAFSCDGELLAVYDSNGDTVLFFDIDEEYYMKADPLPSEKSSGTKKPKIESLVFDQNDTLFIADSGLSMVHKYSRNGRYISSFGGPGSIVPVGDICAIVVNDSNEIVTASRLSSVVRFYNTDGEYIREVQVNKTGNAAVHLARAPCNSFIITEDAKNNLIHGIDGRTEKCHRQFGRLTLYDRLGRLVEIHNQITIS